MAGFTPDLLLAGFVYPTTVAALLTTFAAARAKGALDYTKDRHGRVPFNMLSTVIAHSVSGRRMQAQGGLELWIHVPLNREKRVRASLRWRNLGDRERPKRRFSQKTAEFRRFTSSPGNSSISRTQETYRRKPQIFAENRRFSQKTAGNRRLGSVTLNPSPLARP